MGCLEYSQVNSNTSASGESSEFTRKYTDYEDETHHDEPDYTKVDSMITDTIKPCELGLGAFKDDGSWNLRIVHDYRDNLPDVPLDSKVIEKLIPSGKTIDPRSWANGRIPWVLFDIINNKIIGPLDIFKYSSIYYLKGKGPFFADDVIEDVIARISEKSGMFNGIRPQKFTIEFKSRGHDGLLQFDYDLPPGKTLTPGVNAITFKTNYWGIPPKTIPDEYFIDTPPPVKETARVQYFGGPNMMFNFYGTNAHNGRCREMIEKGPPKNMLFNLDKLKTDVMIDYYCNITEFLDKDFLIYDKHPTPENDGNYVFPAWVEKKTPETYDINFKLKNDEYTKPQYTPPGKVLRPEIKSALVKVSPIGNVVQGIPDSSFVNKKIVTAKVTKITNTGGTSSYTISFTLNGKVITKTLSFPVGKTFATGFTGGNITIDTVGNIVSGFPSSVFVNKNTLVAAKVTKTTNTGGTSSYTISFTLNGKVITKTLSFPVGKTFATGFTGGNITVDAVGNIVSGFPSSVFVNKTLAVGAKVTKITNSSYTISFSVNGKVVTKTLAFPVGKKFTPGFTGGNIIVDTTGNIVSGFPSSVFVNKTLAVGAKVIKITNSSYTISFSVNGKVVTKSLPFPVGKTFPPGFSGGNITIDTFGNVVRGFLDTSFVSYTRVNVAIVSITATTISVRYLGKVVAIPKSMLINKVIPHGTKTIVIRVVNGKVVGVEK